MAKITPRDIVDAVKDMTILELKEITDLMKDELGIDPSAVAVAAPAAGGAAPAAGAATAAAALTPNSSSNFFTKSLTSISDNFLISSTILSKFAIIFLSP